MINIQDKELENINKLISLIEKENRYQLDKWGVQIHTPFEWINILGEEYGELCKTISEHYYRGDDSNKIIEEAIQVATLALKIAEMHMSGVD